MIRFASPPRLAIAWLAMLMLSGCSEPDAPQVQVRKALEELETAAENRDASAFREGISDAYRDREGRDAAEIISLVRGYFVLNQSIHLLTRIEHIDFPTPSEAQAKVAVGMVGADAEAGSAWNLAAQVHDFDVTLRREDDAWRVIYAEWRRPH